MARRRMSNPLALAVLACLVERPMHPYEISTTLRSRGKEQSIKLNYGSLYSVVESLEKHGLIRARETTREGRRPERTVYEITDAGAIECEDWLAELISVPIREFTSLEAGLSLLPLLAPMEAARLLDDRAERLRIEQRVIDAAHAEAASIELPEIFTDREHISPHDDRRGVGLRHRARTRHPLRRVQGRCLVAAHSRTARRRHRLRATRRGSGRLTWGRRRRAGSNPQLAAT